MLKKIKNNLVIQRILSIMLVIVWMVTVFIFSSQDGTKTLNTSGAFIYAIESKVSDDRDAQKLSNNDNGHLSSTDENDKYMYKYSGRVQTLVRKNAHYFLYMIGGIVLSLFFCTILRKKNIEETRIIPKKKVPYAKYMFCAISVGIIYACTDEFHQKFVPGRTSSLRDVCIDSIGVLTGTIILFLLKTMLEKRKIKKV